MFFAPPAGLALLLGSCVAACQTEGAGTKAESQREENTSLDSPVVARIGRTSITVSDVEDNLERRESFVRTRYSAPEKKREFLDQMVRFELLAAEAEKKGYHKDPDLIRMYKQWLVARLVQKEFDPQYDEASLPDEEVRAYYEAHPDEVRRPEEAEGLLILVKTPALAKRVAGLAHKLAKDDVAGFADLVASYSEDTASQRQGGATGRLTKDDSRFPQPFIEALFALEAPGDVAGPLPTERGHYIVRLTKHTAAYVPPFEEVAPLIRERLNATRRSQGMDEWVARLKAEAKIEIFEDQLAAVHVGAPSLPARPAHADQVPVSNSPPKLAPRANP